MRVRNLLLGALFLAFGAGTASATTLHFDVSFFGSNFTGSPGGSPNPAIVHGTFSVNLDPTQDYTDQTSGITASSINLAVDSALAFSYNHTTDEFTIGGSANGASIVNFSPATNDFWLFIHHFSALFPNSEMFQLGYAQTADGNNQFFTPQLAGHPLDNPNGFAFVSSTGPVVAATPLPAGLPLFLTALAGLGVVVVARKKIVASPGALAPLS